jgi:3-deoxy-D-manno-octulosonic acid (KDO) 8-phosphate synthase
MPTLSLIKPTNRTGKIRRVQTPDSPKEASSGTRSFRLKALAEAVILQAVEDLWSDAHREKSREFFTGDGFKCFANMAGMGAVEQLRLIKILGRMSRAAR